MRNTTARFRSAEIIFVEPQFRNGLRDVVTRDASRASHRHPSVIPSSPPPPHGGDQTSPDESRPMLPAFEYLREDRHRSRDRDLDERAVSCFSTSERKRDKKIKSFDNQIETKKMLCEANRKIHVDFGEIETGVTTFKWLEIFNKSCVSVQLLVYI